MVEDKEKCISPWFGFLVIIVVCILIASAIFFEFKGESRHGRARLKAAPNKVLGPQPQAPAAQDKLVF